MSAFEISLAALWPRFASRGVHLLACGLVALAALGANRASDPSQTPDLSGTWRASGTESGGGFVCVFKDIVVQLTQQDTVFSGTYSGGQGTCTGPSGKAMPTPADTGKVVAGRISGNRVSFDLNGPDSPLTGTVSGNSVSGTGTHKLDFGRDGVLIFTVNWSAVRP